MKAIRDCRTILFQGDSITDCKRDRENLLDMGRGYPMMVSSRLDAAQPDAGRRWLNRGCSGDRVADLVARWREDCLNLQPDLLSVLIGINDTWKRYKNGLVTTPEQFYADYRLLLTQARDNCDATLVLCEPFVLPVPEERNQWREDLDDKITAVRALAREFHAVLVPLDGILNAAAARREPEFWAQDGIHPTQPGHALIAREWLRATGLD